MSVTQWLQRSRSRGATHALLLGVVIGMLVVGVAVPFVFGERIQGSSATAGSETDSLNFDSPGSPGASGAPGAPGTVGGAPLAGPSAGPGLAGGAASLGPGTTSGVGPTAGSGGGPSGQSGAVNNGGATDQGVTATTVKIGVFYAQCVEAGTSFGFTCIDAKIPYDAYFKEINARGGIHGRKIQPVYYEYNPGSEADMRTKCIAATEDDKVFATINWFGYYGRAITCVTDEHHVPFMSYAPEVDQWYKSGLHYSFGLSMNRMLRTQVAELDRVGLLRGHTLGVMDSTYPTIDLAVKNALLPELKSRGYKVASRCQLSSDLGEAQSQMPVCVQQMKAAGVDSVILANNLVFTTLFVQQADNQAFKPKWLNSDVALGAQDLSTLVMPPAYEGAIAVTGWNSGEDLVGTPEKGADADCGRRFNASTGRKTSREGERNGDPPYHGAALISCSLIDTVAYGIDRAGPNLTRKGYAAALAQRGPFDATILLGDSFRPGKPTSTDLVRFVQWHYNYKGRAECRCWVPISSPRQAEF